MKLTNQLITSVYEDYVNSAIEIEEDLLVDNGCRYYNIVEDDIETVKEEIKDFLNQAIKYLNEEWVAAGIGYNLYLTRNRHGAGFWDRGLPFGDELTDIAHEMCSQDLYVTDSFEVGFS